MSGPSPLTSFRTAGREHLLPADLKVRENGVVQLRYELAGTS